MIYVKVKFKLDKLFIDETEKAKNSPLVDNINHINFIHYNLT